MIRLLLLLVAIVGAVLGRTEVHSHTSIHHGSHAATHHGGHTMAHHRSYAASHHGSHAVTHHGVHAALHHGGLYPTHHPVPHHPLPHHSSTHHAPARNTFDYAVHDAYSGNHFGHNESHDGYNTRGSYFVHLPDGNVQTVTYNADQYGYHPAVSYSGTAHHPAHHAPAYHAPAIGFH